MPALRSKGANRDRSRTRRVGTKSCRSAPRAAGKSNNGDAANGIANIDIPLGPQRVALLRGVAVVSIAVALMAAIGAERKLMFEIGCFRFWPHCHHCPPPPIGAGIGRGLCIRSGDGSAGGLRPVGGIRPDLPTLAPGSLRKNNEEWSTKSRSLRQGRECHGSRIARQACDRDWR